MLLTRTVVGVVVSVVVVVGVVVGGMVVVVSVVGTVNYANKFRLFLSQKVFILFLKIDDDHTCCSGLRRTFCSRIR